MILWRLYQQKLEAYLEQVKVESRVESRVEGRIEGRIENHQLWEAWNNRRIEAESQSRPFNEPPPPPPVSP